MSDSLELSEDVDLDMETRRYVLDVYAQLERINYYAILGVSRTADRKAVKDAYFRLAGLVHPDRYFGKRLGSFKPKTWSQRRRRIGARFRSPSRFLTTGAASRCCAGSR